MVAFFVARQVAALGLEPTIADPAVIAKILRHLVGVDDAARSRGRVLAFTSE